MVDISEITTSVLRKMVARTGMSQRDLAEAISVSVPTVGNYTQGKTKRIPDHIQKRIRRFTKREDFDVP
jgi:transcriptional regulator with XRE-family HTH domain